MLITDLNIDKRFKTYLLKGKHWSKEIYNPMTTVEELLNLTEPGLCNLQGIGYKGLIQILAALGTEGKELKEC